MRVRKYGSFGALDWKEWPQLYHPDFVHFACIPCPLHGKVENPAHSEFPDLWRNFGKESFVEETGHQVISGLGKISPYWTAVFHHYLDQIQQRVSNFLRTHSNPAETDIATYLSVALSQLLTRLQQLSCQFHQMLYTACTFQHLFLELLGLLQYCEVYKPLMNTPGTSQPVATGIMGAFVMHVSDAELFFRAGIPYYMVHPVRNLSRICVDYEAPVRLMNDEERWMDKIPPSHVIYEGPLDIKAQYKAVARYGSSFFGFGNAFKESSNGNDHPSSETQGTAKSTLKDKPRNHPCKY